MSHLLKTKSSASLQSYSRVFRWKEKRGRTLSEPKDIDILDQKGVDKDVDGRTLLFYPVKYGLHSIAEDMLESGQSPNVIDSKGDHPIHLAVHNSDVKMIKLLIAHGADLHAKNYVGQSPMQQAVCYDDVTVVRALHEAGASLNEKDIGGLTVFDVALRDSRKNVCLYLIQNGCEARTVDKYRELHLKTSERSSHVSLLDAFKHVFKNNKSKQNSSCLKEDLGCRNLFKFPNNDKRKDQTTNKLKSVVTRKLVKNDKTCQQNVLQTNDIEIPHFTLLEIST